MLTRDNYTLMCMQLVKHRFLYYVLAEPEISDQKYDALEKELMQFEKDNPDMVHEKSPTKTVGSDSIDSYPSGLVSIYRGHPRVKELMSRQGLKWTHPKDEKKRRSRVKKNSRQS